jgi:2-oxo-4-hydroxy-4-carboxy--5-ureidoimidazoline (OHCU) decarboxylase
VEELAVRDDPLGVADEVAAALPEEDKIAALNTHPRIGEASAEQRGDVPAELAELNRAYEQRFGFKFVVFVAGRPRSELVPVLRERLERTREEELATGLRELVAIARDRWTRT